MTRCHFTRAFNIPLSKVYDYYSNIEEYTQRYPRHYSKIDVISSSDNSINTRQFLNISLDKNQDHVNVEVKYTFVPQKEIQYEIKGYGETVIKNSMWFRGEDTVGKGYQCAVEINHVPLDLICYPPHSMERDMIGYNEYSRMIEYLMEQDLQHLENKRMGWRIGDSCKKCGKGTLQSRGKKEDTGDRRIETLVCDYCRSEFANQRVESYDTIVFDDVSPVQKNNEALLGKFFEDALNYSVNEYIRKIKNDFRQYDLNKIVGSEFDVILGMVINEIFNRFSDSASKNSIKITEKENRFFYQNIAMINLRNIVRHMLEV